MLKATEPIRSYKAILETLRIAHQPIDKDSTSMLMSFGANMFYDLSNGQVPWVSTQEPLCKDLAEQVVKTAFFILKGKTSIKGEDAESLSHCALTEEGVREQLNALVAQGVIPQDQLGEALTSVMNSVGEIGPHYGHMWRHWPRSVPAHHEEVSRWNIEEFPPEVIQLAKEHYEAIPTLEERLKVGGYEQIAKMIFFQTYDQLANVIKTIKEEGSGVAVLQGYNPVFAPMEGIEKQKQPFLMRSGVNPSPALFQISFDINEAGEKEVHFSLYFLRIEFMWKYPRMVAMFATIAHLIAREAKAKAQSLRIGIGEYYIFENEAFNKDFSEAQDFSGAFEFKLAESASIYNLNFSDVTELNVT